MSSSLQDKKKSEAKTLLRCGGDKGSRTPDLLTASQTRSQLRYTPI